jgi:hypothetical protein
MPDFSSHSSSLPEKNYLQINLTLLKYHYSYLRCLFFALFYMNFTDLLTSWRTKWGHAWNTVRYHESISSNGLPLQSKMYLSDLWWLQNKSLVSLLEHLICIGFVNEKTILLGVYVNGFFCKGERRDHFHVDCWATGIKLADYLSC